MLISSLRDVIRQQSGEIELLQKQLKEARVFAERVSFLSHFRLVLSFTRLPYVDYGPRDGGFFAEIATVYFRDQTQGGREGTGRSARPP